MLTPSQILWKDIYKNNSFIHIITFPQGHRGKFNDTLWFDRPLYFHFPRAVWDVWVAWWAGCVLSRENWSFPPSTLLSHQHTITVYKITYIINKKHLLRFCCFLGNISIILKMPISIYHIELWRMWEWTLMFEASCYQLPLPLFLSNWELHQLYILQEPDWFILC